jgi:hypothetical protein
MTDDMMNPRALVEKSANADLPISSKATRPFFSPAALAVRKPWLIARKNHQFRCLRHAA